MAEVDYVLDDAKFGHHVLVAIGLGDNWGKHEFFVLLKLGLELSEQRRFTGNRVVAVPLPQEGNDSRINNQFIHGGVCSKGFRVRTDMNAVPRSILFAGY